MVEKKVTVSTLVAALVTIAVWLIRTFTGFEIPADVTAAIITVVVGVAGYLAPHTMRTDLTPESTSATADRAEESTSESSAN